MVTLAAMRRNQGAAEDEYVFRQSWLVQFTHLSQLSQRHILSDSGYIRMDLLARESEKLALLQETILLLPNSLTVKEFPDRLTSLWATHLLELCLTYALAAEVKILVTLAKPLDFTVLTPNHLPAASMLGIVEVEDDTSLVDLVKMLVKALQKHHTSLLEGTVLDHMPGDIAHLTQVFPSMRHELAVVADKLTLILCFKSEEKVSICSVNNLLKANKLVNTADHCFNIKMEFVGGIFNPAGFGVQWSPDLQAMLPELADIHSKSEKLADFTSGFQVKKLGENARH